MNTEEQNRRSALVSAVAAYHSYYLSAKHHSQTSAEFVAEIRQELREAAADKNLDIVYVAIIYQPRVSQGALVMEAKP